MKDIRKDLRLAIIQATPVLFDKEASLKIAVNKIEEAAKNGAEFIVFPELFIPGYPFGMNFGFSVGKRTEAGREDWKRYYENSITVPSEETKILSELAKKHSVYISMGISERDEVDSSLYNSNIIIKSNGEIDPVHRKLKPTGSERVVWADADKGYFPITNTPWGPAGSMICWESYMPLARVALYEKGITLYISPNTNDNPEWQDTIKHIAIEGRCYFINADLLITKESYPKDLNENSIESLPEIVCRGGSCVVDPFGHYVTEPVWDREEIIYADLDMEKTYTSKMEFDVSGHYTRNDVLKLTVDEK